MAKASISGDALESTDAVNQGNADIASDYSAMANYYTGASANGVTQTGAPANATGDYLVNGTYTAATAPATTASTTSSTASSTSTGLNSAQVQAMINASMSSQQSQAQIQMQNAENEATSLLTSYGLTGNIGAGVTSLFQAGLDATTITTILNSPNPQSAINGLGLSGAAQSAATNLVADWQTRFSGNQTRIAQGLAPLDPATYIQYEQTYKQLLSASGVASTSPLMDNSYIGQLIGADVSTAEMQQRVSAAQTVIQNEDPYVLAQLQSQYGLTQSTIMSHLLDPTVSAATVNQEVNAAQIAGAAVKTGAGIAYGPGTGVGQGDLTAMQLAAQGVSQAQAQTGFQTIATQQPALQGVANLYGAGILNPNQVGQALQASTFGTTVGGISAGQAQTELQRLQEAQSNAFSGSAGASTGSLGAKDISGSL
jgi:hypothetical protein